MISKKCHYALRAVLELAKRESEKRVSIGEIARTQHIPQRFLEAIMRQLKQAGITDSIRGKDGGYFLVRPARLITVGEVIRVFEEALARVKPSEQGSVDVFEVVWEQSESALDDIFRQFNFSDLVQRERDLLEEQPMNYSI